MLFLNNEKLLRISNFTEVENPKKNEKRFSMIEDKQIWSF